MIIQQTGDVMVAIHEDCRFTLTTEGVVLDVRDETYSVAWPAMIPNGRFIYYRFQMNPHRLNLFGTVEMSIPTLRFIYCQGMLKVEVRKEGIYLFKKVEGEWDFITLLPKQLMQDRSQGAPCKRIISFMNNLRRLRRLSRMRRAVVDETDALNYAA